MIFALWCSGTAVVSLRYACIAGIHCLITHVKFPGRFLQWQSNWSSYFDHSLLSLFFFFFLNNSKRDPFKIQARSCPSSAQNPAVTPTSFRVEAEVLTTCKALPAVTLTLDLSLSLFPAAFPSFTLFQLLQPLASLMFLTHASCSCLTACVSALPETLFPQTSAQLPHSFKPWLKCQLWDDTHPILIIKRENCPPAAFPPSLYPFFFPSHLTSSIIL